MSATRHIEARHEINLKQRIVDVRPWSERTAEKLTETFNAGFCAAVLLVATYEVPIISPITFVLLLIGHFTVMNTKSLLPYRYPIDAKDPESKKDGEGILFLGSVRSDSPFECFKEAWLSDDDLRKHWLILGSTGSGKSEMLKGVFYNVLCWGSGFFAGDGKADNKLPTDGYTMVRAFGRDDSLLYLNFLLGGKTPQEVARSRRRRTNKINPFSGADADTIIQMGANLLPKAEGDGKSWQEKALALWRAVVTALCYRRDTQGETLSIGKIIDYLSLNSIEELYLAGYDEAQRNGGEWSYGYAGIKNYLDSGCPSYQVEKLLKKSGRIIEPAQATAPGARPRPAAASNANDQDNMAYEQHAYRTGQLMPVMNLLDKTYSYIFRASHSEIDMIDVALHNRILFLLIPSLEKSSQEAENLGKLTIACLRVMMAKNLGSEIEGSRAELLDSKATNAPYPYVAALDELGYWFADGIAVMFAQARSLGISMLALSQDLEKLTEGSRAAEAGAMLGNAVNKVFMKIDDAKKTWDLVRETVSKAYVAVYSNYESAGDLGWKKKQDLSVLEIERVSFNELQSQKPGQAVVNALGKTTRISTFFMGDWLNSLNNKKFHINRFLQVNSPSVEAIMRLSIPASSGTKSALDQGKVMLKYLRHQLQMPIEVSYNPVVDAISEAAKLIPAHVGPVERGILLYLVAEAAAGVGESVPGLFGEVHDGVQIRQTQVRSDDRDSDENQAPATPAAVDPMIALMAGGAENLGRLMASDGLMSDALFDPLALMRRPQADILPVSLTSLERPAVISTSTQAAIQPESLADTPINELSQMDQFSGIVAVSDDLDDLDDTSEVTASGWIGDALRAASMMRYQPRSVDDSVVGFSEETYDALVDVEEQLGSVNPVASARTLQAVVAARLTPDTIAREGIDNDSMEGFFANITPSSENRP